MPQFKKLTPNLVVANVERSLAFYVDINDGQMKPRLDAGQNLTGMRFRASPSDYQETIRLFRVGRKSFDVLSWTLEGLLSVRRNG